MSGCKARSRGTRWLSLMVVSRGRGLFRLGIEARGLRPLVVCRRTVVPAAGTAVGTLVTQAVVALSAMVGRRVPAAAVSRGRAPALDLDLYLFEPLLRHPLAPLAVVVE